MRLISQTTEKSATAMHQIQNFIETFDGKSLKEISDLEIEYTERILKEIADVPIEELIFAFRLLAAVVENDSWSEAASELVLFLKLNFDSQKTSDHPSSNLLKPEAALELLRLANLITNCEFVLSGWNFFTQMGSVSRADLLLRNFQNRSKIRQNSYRQLQREIDLRIFGGPKAQRLLLSTVGFDLQTINEVNDRLTRNLSANLNAVLDSMMEQKRNVLKIRSQFSVPMSALEHDLQIDLVQANKIVEAFEYRPDPSTSVQKILDSWRARPDALWGRVYVDGTTVHLLSAGLLGGESPRSAIETLLSQDETKWAKYLKLRGDATEEFTSEVLQELLPGWHHSTNVNFVGAHGDVALNKDADLANRSISETFEIDHIASHGRFLIAVDAKSGSTARLRQSRTLGRFKSGLSSIVTKGDEQTLRICSLIKNHKGFWKGSAWVDLPDVLETFSLVVSLEDVGDIASQSGALADAQILQPENRLILISLHDLLVIRDVRTEDFELIAYLRHRSSSDVWKYFAALEELDLFSYFLSSGLHVPPDPRILSAKYLNYVSNPKAKREYAEFEPRFLNDQLELFNVIFEPELHPHQDVQLSDLRAGKSDLYTQVDAAIEETYGLSAVNIRAELLTLSSDSWSEIAKALQTIQASEKSDHLRHSYVMEFYSRDNALCLVFMVLGRSEGADEQVAWLEDYLIQRKYFMQATLALGCIFASNLELESVKLLDFQYEYDERLAAEVAGKPFRKAAPSLPPYAKRAGQQAKNKKRR